MYKFKQIKATYNFTSEVIQPSGVRCVYTKTELVTALPNLVEGLNFTLHGSIEETINKNPLKDFDLIMSRLGHSLYPVELNILKTGRLKRIKNFIEIKKRWREECKSILSTHKNAYWVERYLNMTSKNTDTEESFTKAFIRNSFVQLFFMEEGAPRQKITVYDFPRGYKPINIDFELEDTVSRQYRYKSSSGNVNDITSISGTLFLIYSDKGLPLKIVFLCRIEIAREGYYTKRVQIEQTDQK
ncbi:MAG: hypothetical protein LIP00_05760 [Parabacteroides sp.]|nr:hypothetical protein [Parabacteroides sp.]